MMTIAIITYDISPYRGSEASVSWNYVCNMRFYHKLIVLYGRGKEEIEKYLQANELENAEKNLLNFLKIQNHRSPAHGFHAYCT